MSGSLEEAYVAVERAYGQGDFATALERATALQTQVPPGRPDQLDQRLQLLIGHIHLYGLNEPLLAESAYASVLEAASEPAYRALASEGLELSRQRRPAGPVVVAVEAAAAAPAPAMPWLSQLRDPELARRQLAAVSPQPAQAAQTAASPWQTSEAVVPVVVVVEPELPTASVLEQLRQPEPEPESELELPSVVEPPLESVAALAGEAESAPEPEAELEPDAEPEPEAELTPEPVEPDSPPPLDDQLPEGPAVLPFNEEEWADYASGLLLVDYSTSVLGPRG